MTTDPKNPGQGLLSSAVLGQLSEFMIAAFKGEELRRLLANTPHGRHLHALLPGELASLQETVDAMIALVQRHGIVSELFEVMANERPARWREIDKIKRLAEHDLHNDPRTAWLLFPGMPLRGGRYELISEIGGGGYGDVWKALDCQKDQLVALKFLRWRGSRLDEDSRRRFFRGARTMVGVCHPCIAQIVEPRCEEGGYDYYSMEYIDGITLREAILLKQIPRESIVSLLVRVGDGIEVAHAHNLIHRDIHPRNILVTADGTPKVIDFDLVRDIRFPETRTGAVGTWVYTAPEVFEAVDVDVRSDVFSLAVTAVFAFSGRDLPPDRYNNADMQRFVREELACDPEVRAVLARACEWKQELRYPTMRAFCDALGLAEAAVRAAQEAAERVAREAAERAAREAAERAAREAAERAAREAAERAAREAAERAAREAAERAAREAAERAAREAAERVAREAAERSAAEHAARSRAARGSTDAADVERAPAARAAESAAGRSLVEAKPDETHALREVGRRGVRESFSSVAVGLVIVLVITLSARVLLSLLGEPSSGGSRSTGQDAAADANRRVEPERAPPLVDPGGGTSGNASDDSTTGHDVASSHDDSYTTTSDPFATAASSSGALAEPARPRPQTSKRRIIDPGRTTNDKKKVAGVNCVTDEQRRQLWRLQAKENGTILVKIVAVGECENMWLVINGFGVGTTPWTGYLKRYHSYDIQWIDSVGRSENRKKTVHIPNDEGFLIDNR